MMPGNPVVGGTVLRRAAVQSPNYVTGSAGWTVNADGSAEFDSLTVRGTFDGTDFIVNSSGAFFYSATPAAGNLIISVAPAAGTDSFGNAYARGIQLGAQGATSQIKIIPGLAGQACEVQFTDPTGTLSNSPNLAAGLGGAQSNLLLSGPALVTAGRKDWVQFGLFSNDGGANHATAEFLYISDAQVVSVMAYYNAAGWNIGTLAVNTLSVTNAMSALSVNNLTVNGTLTVGGSSNTSSNHLSNSATSGTSSTAGLTDGTIAGTSGGASAGTAHTHGPGSFAVTNGQHSHGPGTYGVTNDSHLHAL